MRLLSKYLRKSLCFGKSRDIRVKAADTYSVRAEAENSSARKYLASTSNVGMNCLGDIFRKCANSYIFVKVTRIIQAHRRLFSDCTKGSILFLTEAFQQISIVHRFIRGHNPVLIYIPRFESFRIKRKALRSLLNYTARQYVNAFLCLQFWHNMLHETAVRLVRLLKTTAKRASAPSSPVLSISHQFIKTKIIDLLIISISRSKHVLRTFFIFLLSMA